MIETLYLTTLTATFAAFVALTLFKKEMKNKSKYKDFIIDAIDAIENNSAGNHTYSHTSCSGISFLRNEDGEIEAVSQSKLCGTAINH